MTTMEPGFEDKLRRAGLDAVEESDIVDRVRDQIAQNFREYAARWGYDLGDAIDSLAVVELRRTRNGIFAVIEGDHPLGLFELGADPHRIEGDPLHWVDEATGEDVFVTHVDHPGLPESRATRDALADLRRDLT